MSEESSCGCEKGYAEVPVTSASSVSTGTSINTTTYTAPTTVASVQTPVIALSVSDYQGYAPAEVVVEEVVENKSCGLRACNVALQKVCDSMKSAVCATRIRFLGIDEDHIMSKFCTNGYLYIDDEGFAEVVESLPINAEDLLHETTVLPSGQVGVGNPICAPHIALTDSDGKVWSQKPTEGIETVLVGDGVTGLWCQKPVSELPQSITEYTGTYESFINGVCGGTVEAGMYFFTGDTANAGHYSVVDLGGVLEIRKLDYTVVG